MTDVQAAPEAKNPAQGDNAATVINSQPAAQEQSTVMPDWPDDWRSKIAGDDAKLLARLDRFTSPKDVVKSWREAEKKISSGDFKRDLPKDATAEDVAAWRAENGIPESTGDYFKKFEETGFLIGEQDKPRVTEFLQKVHEFNLKPEIAQDIIKWDLEQKQIQAEQKSLEDQKFKEDSIDKLRQEWGNDYRVNVNIIENLLTTHAPEGFINKLSTARLADGNILGNDPETLNFLANLARLVDPVATVVPGSGMNSAQTIESEIEQLRTLMKTDIDAWRKDTKKQERYTQLLEAQQRIKK